MTAAIIGGGIAGLTAAYDLVRAGERPILIEPGRIGGMITSIASEGFTLEAGPNVLVERSEMSELLAELGLTSSVRYPSVEKYGQYVWYNDRPVKVPAGLGEFLACPLFSLLTKISLPLKLVVPGVLPSGARDVSVEAFFAPLLGTRAARHLLDPVLKGIYGGDVEDLSARSLFSGLWGAAQEKRSVFGYMMGRRGRGKPPIMVLRGGIQSLADRLWDAVATHVELVAAKAERLTPLDGGRFRVSLSDGRHLEVDGCIVTSAGKKAASLLYFLDEQLSGTLGAARYASLQVAHVSVARSERLIPGAFGILFPRGMPLHLLGCMFNSQIFPEVAPADKHLVTVVLGGAQAGQSLASVDAVREELPTVLRRFLGVRTIEWHHFTEWPEAIPQLSVGHYTLVEGLDRLEREHPGIVIASVDRGGVGVSDRIRLAREAVKRFRRMRVETVV